MMNFYNSDSEFNRYTNLEGIEWRIINALVKSDSKYAKKLWRMLKYNTADCISDLETCPELTNKEKYALIYRDNAEGSDKKVFMAPFLDDAWTEQSARLDVYVSDIDPTNHVIGNVGVTCEIVVHNKINNIYGDAEEGNENTIPTELDDDGNMIIPSKSRATTMLKCLVAALNGLTVEGVGVLQLNSTINMRSNARSYVWNNRSYFGFAVTFYTVMGQSSENPSFGW